MLTHTHADGVPFVPGHWVIGVGPQIVRRPLELLTELGRLGDVVRFRLPAMPSVLVNHPELVRRVLHDSKTYDKRMRSYDRMRPLIGDGLVTSEGEHWLRQRRIAQPSFQRSRIQGFGATMVRFAEATRDAWRWPASRGEPVDVVPDMTRLTLGVVCEALFGGDVPEDTQILARSFGQVVEYLVDRLNVLWSLPPWVPTPDNVRFRRSLAALDAAIGRIIARRHTQAQEGADLLSTMMRARDADTGEGMSDVQLRDEMKTLLLGGHETTAMTLSWAIALLAQHPDAQDKLRAELAAAIGERSPAAEDLEHTPYLCMVVDEVMRLYPPVFLLARNAARDDELGRCPVPRGTAVFISPWAIHRSPALWDSPGAFWPERFTPERAAGRHRYAYLPFIAGPRVCIGNHFALMEARLVLAVLAQRYRFRLAPGSVPTPDPCMTLRPRGDLRVLLEPL
jgi:cytochrome P450